MLNLLIKEMQVKHASSMHMSAGLPPLYNINGRLLAGSTAVLAAEEISELTRSIMNEHQHKRFIAENSINFMLMMETGSRLRVSLFRQRGQTSAVFRPINDTIPDYASLHLPEALNTIAALRSGLVVIGGPAGSGKSSTLAAILNEINQKRCCHVVTLEDPIEYFHEPRQSLFSQREIGVDSFGYPTALREAIRQDADVIMVGDMRELETIAIALNAAETGTLVLATMHTSDCVQTVSRLVGAFPPDHQHQVRAQVAVALKAVFCQQLVMRSDNSGRVPAVEIMISTQGIQNLIREKQFHQIYSAIESGAEKGMQTLDQALQKLYQEDAISDIEVVTRATKPELLRKKIFEPEIPVPDDGMTDAVTDLGEEMINIDKKMVCYRANFAPGMEGYWTSSVSVSFYDPGMIVSVAPGMPAHRVYVSDFNIVSKKIAPFPLPHRMLIRFKIESGNIPAPDESSEFLLKLFAQPEQEKLNSYHKINLAFPLNVDDKWHTWVITIPADEVGKMLKITMFEFPVFLTKILISDIIFF